MSGLVNNKVVIVTGAARGIGAGIAADLAEKGAHVVIADLNADAARQTASKISSGGNNAIAVAVDVSSRASVKALIDETVSRFGRLDVMFNNAGISQTCPFLEVTEEDFDRIMKINGLGVLIGTQEAAKQMIAQGHGGKIINTASVAGKQGYPLFAHYCASKFAVVAITQAAARALAEHKITVNCFGPGVVKTELWEQLDREFMEQRADEKSRNRRSTSSRNQSCSAVSLYRRTLRASPRSWHPMRRTMSPARPSWSMAAWY